MDLFSPAVPLARLHPNFVHVAQKAAQQDREVLVDWANGFVDRDGKFAIEFQTSFNSSFWELYLYAVLKELGHTVDFGQVRPDFHVDTPHGAFVIEATTASNAAGQPAEWEGNVQGFTELADRAPLVHEATVRLSNALWSKYRKYREEYSSLPAVRSRPFVIAVAPFEQPYGRVQNTQAIFQALYAGSATPYEIIDQGAEESPIVTGGVFFDVPTVKKANGADIALGVFRGGRMPEVSAVIFSSVATWGKVRALSMDPNPEVLFETLRSNSHGPLPHHEITKRADYHEGLLDGLCVFHNPEARKPLSWKVFRGPKVTQVTWGENWREPDVESEDRVLLQRTVVTLTSKPGVASGG
jgi:hypothetical protein